ncbi:hypothetical protein [Methanolapillus ohkumae]|uniref:Uncharacterized protein n=1 Tax=Methanolapillus ohkumae TaxID=3028298 RepID=A0AA96VH50_9EURY|nr:hypothetical protein MsAm2_02090 [Methanosarcinaceae archaeon Am2]
MNSKTVLFFGMILIFIFISGCVEYEKTEPIHENSSGTEDIPTEQNPNIQYNTSYETTEFEYGGREKIPKDQNAKYLTTESFYTYVYASPETLEKSDLIVYGTVKEIKPSFLDSNDGTKLSQLTFNYSQDGPIARSDNITIYTDIIFTVNDWAKGNSSDEITVRLIGGEVNNVVQYREMWPSPWDFKEGGQYLLYLTYYSEAYELRAPNGIQKVINEEN